MTAYVKWGVCLGLTILVVHGDALLEDVVLEHNAHLTWATIRT